MWIAVQRVNRPGIRLPLYRCSFRGIRAGDDMLSGEDDTRIKIEAKNGLKNQFRRNPLKVSVRRINLSFSGVPTLTISPGTSMAAKLSVEGVKRCSVPLYHVADEVPTRPG